MSEDLLTWGEVVRILPEINKTTLNAWIWHGVIKPAIDVPRGAGRGRRRYYDVKNIISIYLAINLHKSFGTSGTRLRELIDEANPEIDDYFIIPETLPAVALLVNIKTAAKDLERRIGKSGLSTVKRTKLTKALNALASKGEGE